MGGKSKKQTVGYKYYLGQHLVMCHGPIDNISRATVDDRVAWAGISQGGPINVNSPSLFGGDGREGGVSGQIDIEMGGPAQGKNSYLVSKLGNLIPAYRGVVGAVFRQCYLGNNPYLKPWRFRGQRIYVRTDGEAQWNPGRAAIGSLTGDHAIYIAMDCSGSMDTVVAPGVTRLDNAKASLSNVMDYLATFAGTAANIDIMVVAWGDTRTSITRRNVDASDIAAVKAFINGRSTVGGTNFNQGVADAAAFYAGASGDAKRTCIFVTDGEANAGTAPTAGATLFAIPGVLSYGFNIGLDNITDTLQVDNTPQDSVPVVHGDDSTSLASAVQSVLGNALDMNPAHIIRECLTDALWGMGYLESDVDADSFEDAANKLVLEGLGMSLLWDKQIKLEEFIDEVKKHIDAAVYVSRTTGKFVIKLVRNDYDPDDLITLDESNIARIEDPSRASFGELINSVTVNYWDAATGKDASLTVTDTAMVQMQGVVINTTVQYPGFTNARNASVVGQRDLRTLSSPILSCTIYANSDAKDLNIGDVFKLSWARWGLVDVVMRVTGIAFGTGRSNQVRINCSQDVFSTPTTVVITPPTSSWEDPSQPPTVSTTQVAAEAPYYELTQVLGQGTVDSTLAAKTDTGYVLAAAARAGSAINARMWSDNGTGYEDVGSLDFSPAGTLDEDIDRLATSFTLTNLVDASEIVLGTHFQIDDELMRIDSVDIGTGAVTVGRGVLDTVPAIHLAGAKAIFWDQYAGFDPTEYVEGEEINVKIATVSGAGQLPLDSTPALPVTLAARAIRPYPPADFKVNGEYWPASVVGAFPITFVERNRVQQTSGVLLDFSDGTITPEPGTTYRAKAYDADTDAELFVEDDIVSGHEFPSSQFGSATRVRLELYSVRDDFESLWPQSAEFDYAAGANPMQFEAPYTPPAGDAVVLQFTLPEEP